MKKLLILALALVLALSMFACGKTAETEEPSEAPETEKTTADEPVETATAEPKKTFGPETLIGYWKLEAVESDNTTVEVADLGMTACFEFLADGENVRCLSHSVGKTDDYTMAYDIDGYDIIFHDHASDERGTYDPETDRITISRDNMTMYIARITEEEAAAIEVTDVLVKTNGVLGKWTMKTIEKEGMSMDAVQVGLNTVIEFREDGTALAVFNGTEETDSYTLTDNTITMTSGATVLNGVYDPEADTITIEADGITMLFIRTSKAAQDGSDPLNGKTAELTAENAVGTWTLTKMSVSGITVPASMMHAEMKFTFNADGSSSAVVSGTETDALSWKIADGKLKLFAGALELYEFTYDGNALVLHEQTKNVDMIFEKVDE